MEPIVIRSRNTTFLVILGALMIVSLACLLVGLLWIGLPVALVAMVLAIVVARQAVIFYDGGVVIRSATGNQSWRWSNVESFDVADRPTGGEPVRTLRMNLNSGEQIWLTLCHDPDPDLVKVVNDEVRARRA